MMVCELRPQAVLLLYPCVRKYILWAHVGGPRNGPQPTDYPVKYPRVKS